jgi:RNA polymerase sigma factor (sigma-70 family)
MQNSEEQVYINSIKNGEPAPYAFIVEKYKHMAYTIALKILANEEDAQDVAQESFIKAYQQIRQFEGKSKFSTWLYTIVYRTAISKFRENRIETVSMTDTVSENYAPEHTTPQLEQLQLQDEKRHVAMAIQKLSKTEALLVTLFYINENSVKEIGEITGLSLPNIKIKLFRARKKLERELRFLIENELKSVVEHER